MGQFSRRTLGQFSFRADSGGYVAATPFGTLLGHLLGILFFSAAFGFFSFVPDKAPWTPAWFFFYFVPPVVYIAFIVALIREMNVRRFAQLYWCFVALLIVNIGGCLMFPYNIKSMS